jgi:hypothetical protein
MAFENQNLSGYLCTLLFIFVQSICKACFPAFHERSPIFVKRETAGVLVVGNPKVCCFVRNSSPVLCCFVRNSSPVVSKLSYDPARILTAGVLKMYFIIFHLCLGFPDGFLPSRFPSAFFTYFYARPQHNCGKRQFKFG